MINHPRIARVLPHLEAHVDQIYESECVFFRDVTTYNDFCAVCGVN